MNNYIAKIKLTFNKFKETMRKSIYLQWVKNHQGLIIFCAFLAGFLTFLTYPGVMYSDSYARISTTSELSQNVRHYVKGKQDLKPIKSWLTVTPSFFILFFKELSGNIALYTFTQCFFFLLLVYVFSDLVSPKKYRILNRTVLTIIPVILGFGVFYEPGVGTVTAILAIIGLLWHWNKFEIKFDKIITILLLALLSFVCFGYRTNSLTIVPVLFGMILWRERALLKRIILSLSIISGILLTIIVPKALNVDTMSSYVASFIWEMVSVIQNLPDEKKTKYVNYLDDIFGENTTQEAVKNNTFYQEKSSINPIIWGHPFAVSDISNKNNTNKALIKYWELIKKEPATFLKIKKKNLFIERLV